MEYNYIYKEKKLDTKEALQNDWKLNPDKVKAEISSMFSLLLTIAINQWNKLPKGALKSCMLTSSAQDKMLLQKMRFCYPRGLTKMLWYSLYEHRLNDLI